MTTAWRDIGVSGVHRTNEVNARRARLVVGWVTVFGRVYHLGMQPANYVNSALHPSGVTKSNTSFVWGKGGNVTSAGWQVTLCDPICHVSSRSGVAVYTANCYTRRQHSPPLSNGSRMQPLRSFSALVVGLTSPLLSNNLIAFQ